MMDLGLKGKRAAVFAASKGLGRAASTALAAEGCAVAICPSNNENIEKAAAEIREQTGSTVLPAVVDLSDARQIRSFLQRAEEELGGIDILVTNVGGPPVKTFQETADDEWDTWYNIILKSVVVAVREVIPGMKKRKWGRIINITSVGVKQPFPNLVFSNSLRLAVVGLAKSLSLELGPDNIAVHNVAPGFYATDGLERIVKKRMENGELRDDIWKAWEQSVPLRRIGSPEELGALITFLASEQAGYLTGTTIQADGGRYAGSM
jgi:3-oxoacyl-[acyl-carrier protein] reductase